MRTKAERTLDVITRKDTSYLPSQIAFATGTGKQKVVDAMGFHTWDEFDEYLDNHYHMTCQMDDVVCWYCGDVEKTRLAEKHGCARIDWGTNRVWDRWEMEFDVYAPSGFFNYGHPLADLDKEMLDKWNPPSLDDMDNLFGFAMEEKEQYGEEYLVFVNGYCGIFERAFNLVGFEDFYGAARDGTGPCLCSDGKKSQITRLRSPGSVSGADFRWHTTEMIWVRRSRRFVCSHVPKADQTTPETVVCCLQGRRTSDPDAYLR